jgi:hypothetical protein
MIAGISDVELLRGRWRRTRRSLRLGDPEEAGFASGGLANQLDHVALRFLVQPPDPEAVLLDIEEARWNRWTSEEEIPLLGRKPFWPSWTVAAPGLIRYESPRDDGKWSRYLALLRSGAMDLGLGSDAAWTVGEHNRCLHLVRAVARMWETLHRFGCVVRELEIEGPFEVTAALPGIHDTMLAGFDEGRWRVPYRQVRGIVTCGSAIHVREIPSWPDDAGVRDLAYVFGDWIENVWGSRSRRWLVQESREAEPQFDIQSLGW